MVGILSPGQISHIGDSGSPSKIQATGCARQRATVEPCTAVDLATMLGLQSEGNVECTRKIDYCHSKGAYRFALLVQSYRYEDSCEAVRACTVYRCTWYRYR
jgi:hypothetical protein